MRNTRNQDRRQLSLDLKPGGPRPLPAAQNAKGLIEALADLLLEALGDRTPAALASKGGSHEPQDYR